MKFIYFLMDGDGSNDQRRQDLEEELQVAELQEQLEKEEKLNQILQCAVHGQRVCHSCLCSMIPHKVQSLLVELTMLEEEIISLERKLEELKRFVLQGHEQKKDWHICCQHRRHSFWHHGEQKYLLHSPGNHKEVIELKQVTQIPKAEKTDEGSEKMRCNEPSKHFNSPAKEMSPDNPNKLAEILVRTLISIYHKLNQKSSQLDCTLNNARKLSISCMSSKSLQSKMSFYHKIPISSLKYATHLLNPYDLVPEVEGTTCESGSCKKLVQMTRSSLDMSRISSCYSDIERLRVLINMLCTVEVCSLTYKQKLAFWINIYNACIMHAFLEHGIPSSPDRLLELLNKAAINVGGLILNALAIEHFILRHSSDAENELMDEKETFLRYAYGLGYPEPNITFALCRGTQSSPALQVYTAEDVVNELERAKVEYLEASLNVTSKKKIIVPKLLHWHMQDFADDVESLLEWIYSQLPKSGSLKRILKECLSRDPKIPFIKMVDIEPYKAEFGYLLPSVEACSFGSYSQDPESSSLIETKY